MPLPILLLTGMLAALDPPPAAPHRHAGRPFISPMGEPFSVRGPDDDTLADWFNQADTNRDGSLTLAEMQLDADRFFALLDTNHDGEIDPDEITHYEQVIAPPRAEDRHDGDDAPRGRARFGLLDLPEPVAAADADLSRGISRDEFRKAAQLRFQALDVTRQGRLTLDVLETLRPAPPARPKKDPDAEPVVSPDSDPG